MQSSKKSNGLARMTVFLTLSLFSLPIAAQSQSLLKVPASIKSSAKGTLPPPPKAAQPLPQIQNNGEEPQGEIDTPEEADPAGGEEIDEEGKKKLSL